MGESSPSQLQPISTLPAKIWRIASYSLIGGGLILMGWGGWLLLQRQIEASKPPPAPIVNSLDRLPTDTPTVTPEPTRPPTATAQPTAVLESPTAIAQVTSPTATPEPTETATSTPSPTITNTPDPSTFPLDLEPEDDVLSLADNPLIVSGEAPVESLPDVSAVENTAVDAPPAPITRLVAEGIELDTSVVEVGWQTITQPTGTVVNVWSVAEFAAGWHKNSNLPGQGGNIVFSGHHNIKGEVFRYIVDLEIGDSLTLYMGEETFNYKIEDKFIVKDKGEPEEVRIANARWIGPFEDERVTMVTCWPYNNNTHRVIVIAKPGLI